MEHLVSDDEFYSDESGSSQESDEPTTDKGTDEELNVDIKEQDWSEEINR